MKPNSNYIIGNILFWIFLTVNSEKKLLVTQEKDQTWVFLNKAGQLMTLAASFLWSYKFVYYKKFINKTNLKQNPSCIS